MKYLTVAKNDVVEFLEERLEEGFARVAFIKKIGPWVEKEGFEIRIISVWAIFHPSGHIVTWEWYKISDGTHSIHPSPTLCEYENEFELRETLKPYGVELLPHLPLVRHLAFLKVVKKRKQGKVLRR